MHIPKISKKSIYASVCVLILALFIYWIFFRKKSTATSSRLLSPKVPVNKVITPGTVIKNPNLPPANPIFNPIKIDWVIKVVSTDPNKITNLMNGLGYAHNTNGTWTNVYKFSGPGAKIPTQSGKFYRGQFFIPTGLTDVRFLSQCFLLSTNPGDPAQNPNNIAYIQVHANDELIVDMRPNGADAVTWNYDKWNVGANVSVSY